MRNRSVENLTVNTSGNNQHNSGATSGSKRGFCSSCQRLLVILLLVLLLPISSVAENLSCRLMPMLMEKFLANHYAMTSITGEIETHTIDQMIKSLDASKTLLYESDLERLRQVLENVFTGMQSGDCAHCIRFTTYSSHGLGKTRPLSKIFWDLTTGSTILWK